MPRFDPSEWFEHHEARTATTLRKWETWIILAIVFFFVGGALVLGILRLLWGYAG